MVVTVSDTVSRFLSGPSAYVLLWRQVQTCLVTCSLLRFALFLMAIHVPGSWFTNVLLVLIGVSGIPYLVFLQWAPSKERKERRAGYTTLPRAHRELEQRDPYLGVVIRLAGAEYLASEDFRAIRDRAKALGRSGY